MPEGDVLRRTATRLDRALTGHVLRSAELRWPSVANVDLSGRTVTACDPYGKHLFIRFDDGRSLHSHLRMDGTWRVMSTPAPRGVLSDPFVRAVLATDSRTAVGHRLGMLDVVRTGEEHLVIGHLGPDILAPDFPVTGLNRALERFTARGSVPIAEVLLDQTVLAGIGTIYLAESLFLRGIWPWTRVDRLADPASLLMTARTLMERSVAARVPTTTGQSARGATSWVHGRSGRPCRRCGTSIEVGRAGAPPRDRPVFYCPRCQAVSRRV